MFIVLSSPWSRRHVPSITQTFGKNGFFSIIYCGKTVRSIFMECSGFVYHAEDYCCANFRNQYFLISPFVIN